MSQSFVGLTPAQCQRLLNACIKIENLTIGRPSGPSTYRPGTTQIAHGKLTADVTANSAGSPSSQKGTFQVWLATDPTDPTTSEAANSDIATWDIWPWGLADKTKIPSGTPVFAVYAGGRWYALPPGPQYIGGNLSGSLSSKGTVTCTISYGSSASTVSVTDVDGAFGGASGYPVTTNPQYRAQWNPYTQKWEFVWIAC